MRTTGRVGTSPIEASAKMHFKCETSEIIHKIKTDERFAYSFLYGNSQVPGKSISGLRSRILNQIRMSYGVVVDPADFNTVLYEHLYSEGTWKVLDTYDFKASFYSWLSTVAMHCIMVYLEENHLIKVSRARTVGNTLLKWKDKSSDYCQLMLDDLVHVPFFHDFLAAVMVDRKSDETIQQEFNLDNYQDALKASEKMLKLILINTENYYNDFLVERSARKIMVSSDFLTTIEQRHALNSTHDNPLYDVLGVTPADSMFQDYVIDFLYNFTNKLGWSDEDCFVWQSRFIKNMKPQEVANSLSKRSRPWVDTRYSKLNARFKGAIREWWDNMNI